MRALVLGGAGFIGSHLVEELVRRKFKVTVLDNLSTGDIKNLKSVKNKIKFIKCDLLKQKQLKKQLKKVDYVFHLAGLSKTMESIIKPKRYYDANVMGTLNVLNIIRNLKFKKFIYSASASCYGNSKEMPTSEKAKIQTLSPYAWTKWMAERMIMQQAKIYKFPAISLRLFNVYGPRALATNEYSGVISIFLKQKFKKKPLTVVGDGQQSRSFIYVADVVDIMIKSAKSKIKNEIFNIGSEKPVKINEIVKLLKSKKKNIPKRLNEAKHSYSDIRKIKKQLKWKPKVTMHQGIKNLLKK